MRFPPPNRAVGMPTVEPPPAAPQPDEPKPPAPSRRQGHFGAWNPADQPAWTAPEDSPVLDQSGWQPPVPPSAEAPPAVPPPAGPQLPAFAPPQPETPAFAPPQPGTPAFPPPQQDVPVFPPPQQPARPPFPHATQPPSDGPSSESLRPDRLLRTPRRPPAGGWRRAVYKLTGGMVRPKDSKAERRRQELIERIRQPVAQGHFRVAVMSLKGGVGKTTTTIGLGATLAHQRGDRVIAVDANPDRGTLSEKLRLESPATVRDLLNNRGGVWRYADVRSYTSQAPSRLEVLASDRDPAISEAFNADDYRAVAQILEQFYSIAITDCGTGMLHSAMGAILDMADQIVLVSPVTVDGARSASATLDWLQAHGHQELARDAVVVLSAVKNPRRNPVDLEELKGHFAKRCRAVIGVPFDPHLEQGSEVDLDLLRTSTRDTYLEVGATIADRFGRRADS